LKKLLACATLEVEALAAGRGFPRRVGEDKWLTWGADERGRLVQVVFVLEEDGSVFVIHARPLTEAEKRRHRRRSR
jgi:uncharacterized DUF497 family protein